MGKAQRGTARLFLSRATRDRDIARDVDRVLRSAGYRTFIQDNDFGHASFMARMAEAFTLVDEGATVIALLSHAYQASEYCLKEARYPLIDDPNNLRQRLVVLRIEECEPRDFLKDIPYVDLVPHLHDAAAVSRAVRGTVDPGRFAEEARFATAHERRRQIVHYAIREDARFTGRSEDLARLDRALWRTAHDARMKSLVAVTGMAGVGKSVLTREYAWRNRDRYHGLWWIRAETREGLLDDVGELAGRLRFGGNRDREKLARDALDAIWQGQAERPWLLIYDSAQMPASIEHLLPRGGAHVIITTRWPRWDGGTEVPIDVFPRDTAVRYLTTRARRNDERGAVRLAASLGYLPLALDQAGSYCAGAHRSFDEYDAALAELIRRKPRRGSSAGQYPDSVYATFTLALDRIINGDEARGIAAVPEAEMLMGILAHFDPDRFPLSLITPEILSDIAKGDAAAALEEASLLQIGAFDDGRPQASMHRLVQLVTLARLAEDETKLVAAQLAAQLVWRSEENRVHALDQGERLAAARDQIGEVLARLQRSRDEQGGGLAPVDPEIERQLRAVHAAASRTLVHFASNVLDSWRQGAHFALHVAETDEHRIAIAQPLETLAGLHAMARRYDEAEAALTRAIAIRREHQGDAHPRTRAAVQELEELQRARAGGAANTAKRAEQPPQPESDAAPSVTSLSVAGARFWARLFGRKG